MLRDIRKNYEQFQLDEKDLTSHPFDLFQIWLSHAIENKQDEPTAMTLSTCADGYPDSRVVLLKELNKSGFIFFSNYNSAKGWQIERNKYVALNFFWAKPERQVRVKGAIEKLDTDLSTGYFHSRPRDSQLGAWASEQSSKIKDREELESRFSYYRKFFEGQEIKKPDHWGGYLVIPAQIEFWQGRANRLHDRIRYVLEGNKWLISRLAP
jgi:pyridoxamine 5'-phosphate oxidase